MRNQQPPRFIVWIAICLFLIIIFTLHRDEHGAITIFRTSLGTSGSFTKTKTITHYVSITQTQTVTAPTLPTPPLTETDLKLKLGKHRYRPDGLLEVNKDGPHPIFELMRRAEAEWNEKLKKSSRNIQEAVDEYRRRYKRDPPKGFDLWWEYVKKHNVQLPDEYDQIYHDLEPFWGMEPSDLQAIQDEIEKKMDTYTIGKNASDANVDVLTYRFNEGNYELHMVGAEEKISLIREVKYLIPPFRMTISPDDRPNRLTDWDIKRVLVEAASAQTVIEREALPKKHTLGWISACPPTSPARRRPINLDKPPPFPTKKTFIHNHKKTMDPCQHPDHFHHHGQFLSHNYGPLPQDAMIPEFSHCSTTLHHDIRIPVPYGWIEDILPRDQDPPFDDKLDEHLLWRGRPSGIYHGEETRWERSQRILLVGFTNDLTGTINVLTPVENDYEKVGNAKAWKRFSVNPSFFDIAFVGEPSACSEKVCGVLAQSYPWEEFMNQEESGEYRYIMDVDGNGWSGRFKRLITSNSLIFKSTIYPEWYSDRIQPWLHYVPIQLDYSDLHDALAFFRGDTNGEGSHEDLGRKIAEAGRKWSKTFWRREDMVAYYFRLILEFSRVMSPDRLQLSYRPNWNRN